jgi:hypothetical protein
VKIPNSVNTRVTIYVRRERVNRLSDNLNRLNETRSQTLEYDRVVVDLTVAAMTCAYSSSFGFYFYYRGSRLLSVLVKLTVH